MSQGKVRTQGTNSVEALLSARHDSRSQSDKLFHFLGIIHMSGHCAMYWGSFNTTTASSSNTNERNKKYIH